MWSFFNTQLDNLITCELFLCSGRYPVRESRGEPILVERQSCVRITLFVQNDRHDKKWWRVQQPSNQPNACQLTSEVYANCPDDDDEHDWQTSCVTLMITLIIQFNEHDVKQP
jgi:hypothetical protein